MTPDQIRWLTWGAIQHRPSGAPRWDEPGTATAIAEICGTWSLAIATEHVLAHARDPRARTPFAIKGPAPHTEPERGVRYPAKAGTDCRHHPGEHADGCRACAADQLARPDEPHDGPPMPREAADVTSRIAVLRHNVVPLRPLSNRPDPTDPQGA